MKRNPAASPLNGIQRQSGSNFEYCIGHIEEGKGLGPNNLQPTYARYSHDHLLGQYLAPGKD